MANLNGKLNAVRKRYDKLTPDERIRLMNAADLRGDMDEFMALLASAPKIGWNICHHYGIRTALTELEIVVSLSLCHLSAELFRFMFLRMATIHDIDKIPEGDHEALGEHFKRSQFLDEAIVGFSGALLAHQAAWLELAAEWEMDPKPVMDHFGVVESALKVAERQAGDEAMDPAVVRAELERFMQTVRAEWE